MIAAASTADLVLELVGFWLLVCGAFCLALLLVALHERLQARRPRRPPAPVIELDLSRDRRRQYRARHRGDAA